MQPGRSRDRTEDNVLILSGLYAKEESAVEQIEELGKSAHFPIKHDKVN
jgi:hypothetical protein